jgi:DNA repair photolyase
MKQFKSPVKLPAGGETERCFYPLKLDTYGCGCSHDCTYCYARSSLQFRGLWHPDEPAVASVAAIKKIFASFDNRLIRARVPVRLGGMTDCFANNEATLGTTRRVIEHLNTLHYPYLILTKSALVAQYTDVLDPDLCIVQFTITTPYDDVAALYERGASPTSERLAAGAQLAAAGYHTAARVNPLFPIYPDGYFTRRTAKAVEPLRLFDWSLVGLLAAAQFKTLIAGFVRLSTWNIRWITEATGQDLTYLFTDRRQRNGALHFSTEEKRFYYERLAELCTGAGMEFSVCYDGDDSYKRFRYLWANEDDCCNCFGKVRGFATKYDFYNDNFTHLT